MPSRADIDPTEIVPFLPGIMLVDVVADERRFVYRLVGTREVAMRGRDPTGKTKMSSPTVRYGWSGASSPRPTAAMVASKSSFYLFRMMVRA
jgi:hypothetical protein